MEQKLCEVCHTPLQETWYFCPNCGKKIKEAPPSTSLSKQIGVYALSFFLPPLGLWPGFRYLHRTDQKSKTIGMIAIALTVISLIASVFLAFQLGQSINAQVNDAMKPYQSLGL